MSLNDAISDKRSEVIPKLNAQITKLNISLGRKNRTDKQDFADVQEALVALIVLLEDLDDLMTTVSDNFSLAERGYLSDLPDSHVRLLDKLSKRNIRLNGLLRAEEVQEFLADG